MSLATSKLTEMQIKAEEEAEKQLLYSIRKKKIEKEHKIQKANKEAFEMASLRLSGEILVDVI